jgi:hypothetical protein
MQEIKRYIREVQQVVIYYRKVTTNEQTSSVRAVKD